MRVFMVKTFARWAKRNGITKEQLNDAAYDVDAGMFDADLGGGVYKQRIARAGQGKSRSFRTIVLLKHGDRAFFVYGFAKKDMANIKDDDLRDFKKRAQIDFALPDAVIARLLDNKELVEIL